MNQKNDFHYYEGLSKVSNKNISNIDYMVLGIYLLFGLLIWVFYSLSLFPQKNINTMLLAVAFGGPLCLFQFYYKRFRIKSVTLLWLGVGILQWFVLSAAKRNPDFDAVVGSYADYEENLLVLVILVSLFRFISLSVFQREFILASWTEPEEEQQPKMLDYLFSLVGFLTLAMLATII